MKSGGWRACAVRALWYELASAVSTAASRAVAGASVATVARPYKRREACLACSSTPPRPTRVGDAPPSVRFAYALAWPFPVNPSNSSSALTT
jgi:hypothetical protein